MERVIFKGKARKKCFFQKTLLMQALSPVQKTKEGPILWPAPSQDIKVMSSGEALFCKDKPVPLCGRNSPAVSILPQPLLQTTLITTQSTLKALVPCKGQSGRLFGLKIYFILAIEVCTGVNHAPQDDFGGTETTG